MDALICADRVLTGRAGQEFTDGGVIVEGDRIAAIGTRTALQARSGDRMRVLHYPRSTLMPGLINSHVHLAFDTSGDPVREFQASSPEQLLADMATRASLALQAGITTIRDLGDNGLVFRVRDEIASGARSGPRILASGPPLTVAGGHCWFFGGVVVDDDSIRAMVRRNAAGGADLIKEMASGGQMTPGGAKMWQSRFTAEQLCVVVTEAARAGLRVAAHSHGADAITAAVEAGVHTVEHCRGPRARRHHGATRPGSGRGPARRRRRPADDPRRITQRPDGDDIGNAPRMFMTGVAELSRSIQLPQPLQTVRGW